MMPLIFAATCDLAGKVRGKAFPAADLEKRLKRGVGWTPTNVQINCFDAIAESPFGALGDLLLIPDPDAEVRAEFGERAEHFMLGDIVTLDGSPWEFCTRSLLKSALDRLDRVAGVRLLAAFEHEFQIKSGSPLVGEAYGRGGFEANRALCEALMSQIAAAGLTPDTIMKEYGPNQYEVVIGPETWRARRRCRRDHPGTCPCHRPGHGRGRHLHPDPRPRECRQRRAYPHELSRQGRRACDL